MLRRALWWTSLALTTTGWVLLSPLYVQFPTWIGCLLLGAAGLTAAIAASANRQDTAKSWIGVPLAIAVALASAVAAIVLPWGMRTALAMLTCGAVVVAAAPHHRLSRCTGSGLLIIGLVALIQGSALSLFTTFLGSSHFSSVLSLFDQWMFRLLGTPASVVGRTLYLTTASGPIAVTSSWDQLAIAYGIVAWCGFIVFTALSPSAKHRLHILIKGTLTILAYLLARRFMFLSIAIEANGPHLFWNAIVLPLSILPLFPLLALFSGLRPDGIGSTARASFIPKKRSAALTGATVAFVGTVLMLCALFLVPAGAEKTGRILFDEGHGDWESTLTPIDTETYGMKSTYNYYSLYQWLGTYSEIGQLVEPITESALEGCKVLVLKTPSAPYAPEEIAAIEAYVRKGGGLFVIGDHTNVFGSTSSLNPILATFDLALSYDSTYRLNTGSFTTFMPSQPCFDPIAQHLEQFAFLTSCSLQVPLHAYRTMADTQILSNQADYSTRDFFPKRRFSVSSEFGQFVQAAALLHGRGRVVVFTDSTCFSNFSVFMDGYPAFLLGTLTFLSHENVRFPFRLTALVLALLVLAGLIIAAIRRQNPSGWGAILAGVLIGWAAFSILGCALHRLSYPLPESAEDTPFVYFGMEFSDIDIQPQPATAAEYDRSKQYDTFFVWGQRIERIPQLITAVNRSDVVAGKPFLIINPRPVIDEDSLAWISTYVESGGTLILMDACGRDSAGMATIIDYFGLKTVGPCGSEAILLDAEVVSRVISQALTVHTSSATHGDGRIILVSDSSAFSNLSLGGAFTEPSKIQQALYDTIYWLLDYAERRDASPES